MKLMLPAPSDWIAQARGASLVYHVPAVPGLRLSVTPLLPYPEDAAGWVRRQLAEEAVPPEARVRIVLSSEIETRDGWPASYAEGVIEDGASAEARAVVLYRFLDHGAGVIVRCPDPATFAAHRRAVLDVLGGARPDWGPQDTLSLAGIFDAVVKRPPAGS